MLYTTEIIVKVPLDEFINKMDNIENMKHWQKGLIATEHLSGIPGELGSKLKLTYKFNGRKMDLIETITKSKFPYEFHATYTTKSMHSIQENYFSKTSEGYTKWISKNEFLPFNFMMRVMMFLMPNYFKKQSIPYMNDFKNFAENGISVAHA